MNTMAYPALMPSASIYTASVEAISFDLPRTIEHRSVTEDRANKIQNYFSILQREGVRTLSPVVISEFLSDHQSLIEFSLFIVEEIKKVFPDSTLTLDLLFDPEESNKVLFLNLETALEPADVEKKLNDFTMAKLVPESHFIPLFGISLVYV